MKIGLQILALKLSDCKSEKAGIEDALGLSKEQNKFAYQILSDYGNMSSATVLFVLHAIMQQLKNDVDNKNILSFAFGPGLTLESMLLKVFRLWPRTH